MLFFAVVGTLVHSHNGTVPDVLETRSPHPERVPDACRLLRVADPLRRRDKCAIAARLEIDPAVLTQYRGPAVELVPGVDEMLTACAELGVPMVGLANLSKLDFDQVLWTRHMTSPWLTAIHTSYEIGACTPDPAVFHWLATEYGTATQNMIVIGHHRGVDIAGAYDVGARSIVVVPSEDTPTGPDPTTTQTAPELCDVVPIVRNWVRNPPAPLPNRRLRVAIVLVNEHGWILVSHAPQDGPQDTRHTWHLPGGTVRPNEYASAAAFRTVDAETALPIVVDVDRQFFHEFPHNNENVITLPATVDSEDINIRPAPHLVDSATFVPSTNAASMLHHDDAHMLHTVLTDATG